VNCQANVRNLRAEVSIGLMVNDVELVGNIIDVSEELSASISRAVDEDSSGDAPSITWHHIPDKFNFSSQDEILHTVDKMHCTAPIHTYSN